MFFHLFMDFHLLLLAVLQLLFAFLPHTAALPSDPFLSLK